jgi:hypothetical protein
MNIHRMNIVDINKARKEAERHNTVTRIYAEVYTAIIDVLKKFDGKVMSKRIETALKADSRLAGYNIHYAFEYGMFRVTFWGNGLDYESRSTVHMGYKENPVVDIEKIKESNRGFLAGHIIDLTTLDERINKWNVLLTSIQSFLKTDGDDISFILNKG